MAVINTPSCRKKEKSARREAPARSARDNFHGSIKIRLLTLYAPEGRDQMYQNDTGKG
jgi:hypothetical protein